ncbi:MAG: ABC-type transport auxiliary lipoprotein family protein [Pseudoxanthomonas sp.]|nr:ABC-type transport auxiliary lipoprotein family protein [Pseudoxanthomonas sp.]
MKTTLLRRCLPGVLAPAALLLAGCSVFSTQQRDPVTVYAPLIEVAPDPSWPKVSWQLAVVKPTAARVVDSARIAVRPSPGEIQVYRGVGWSQPSGDLIEATVLRTLEDSGKIGSVARPGNGIRADYRLVMDLRRFDSDYAGSSLPSAVIELNAKLIRTLDQRVVASRTFVTTEPAGATDIPSVVAAFERALGSMGAELAGWTLASGEADARGTR